MKAFLWKNKGYILHAAAVAAVFATPSVQAFLAAHAAYSAVGGLIWGTVLHWANGK